MPSVRPVLAAFALTASLGACAAPPSSPGVVPDPYEAKNRRIHAFNRQVDRSLYRPAAMVYGTVVPAPAREGVANFSDNASQPGYFVNNLLQGRVDDAGHNFFRFALNSTLGVGGIFDPASSFGLERRASDFGETLHVWGVGSGAYVETPLLGPSTQRDSVGWLVDLGLNPLRALAPQEVNPVVFGSYVGEALGDRYVLRETVDQVLYESADSYAQTRDIYLQNRRFELGGGGTEEYLDPYADDDVDPYADVDPYGDYVDPYEDIYD